MGSEPREGCASQDVVVRSGTSHQDVVSQVQALGKCPGLYTYHLTVRAALPPQELTMIGDPR